MCACGGSIRIWGSAHTWAAAAFTLLWAQEREAGGWHVNEKVGDSQVEDRADLWWTHSRPLSPGTQKPGDAEGSPTDLAQFLPVCRTEFTFG